jgi:PEP-CTERM motif
MRNIRIIRFLSPLIAALFLASTAQVAQALVININPISGGGLTQGVDSAQALAAFNRAADHWESVFSDNVTVEISANMLNFNDARVIGRASSTSLMGSFDAIRNAMAADAGNETDDAISAALPTRAKFKTQATNGVTFTNNMVLTQANAMALGFGRMTASDALIEFNSGFSFDYNNADGLLGMDFESVALHEIGHALGFISAVDQVDYLKSRKLAGSVSVNPLDLFRFGTASNPVTVAQFTTYKREMRPGYAAFLDDLVTEVPFSTGLAKGDGRQASHWRDDTLSGVLLGVMDPTLPFDFILPLTSHDIRALDLIGWEYGGGGGGGTVTGLITDTGQTSRLVLAGAVPEPGILALLGAGMIRISFLRRRKRTA